MSRDPLSVLHSSARDGDERKDRWRTPRELFERLDAEFGFATDAAAVADSALCSRWFGPDHDVPWLRDALAPGTRWGRDGPAFVNPPYSLLAPFLRKAHMECILHNATVVALIFARVETAGWWRHVLGRYPAGHPLEGQRMSSPCAAEVRWIPGRLQFLDPDSGEEQPTGTSPAPSVVVVWRPGYAGAWPENTWMRRQGCTPTKMV